MFFKELYTYNQHNPCQYIPRYTCTGKYPKGPYIHHYCSTVHYCIEIAFPDIRLKYRYQLHNC